MKFYRAESVQTWQTHMWNEVACNVNGMSQEEYLQLRKGEPEYPSGEIILEWMYAELVDPENALPRWSSYHHELLSECLWGGFYMINFFGGIPG